MLMRKLNIHNAIYIIRIDTFYKLYLSHYEYLIYAKGHIGVLL